MARSLVIVESPAKAKTINKYLGRNYMVKASYGHVMDLPKKTIGILLPGEENGKKKKKRKAKAGAPGKEGGQACGRHGPEHLRADLRSNSRQDKVIHDLQKAARGAEAIYLAGDPDREGEAICAHLAEILGKPKKYADLVVHEEKEGEEKAPKPPPPRKNRLRPMARLPRFIA